LTALVEKTASTQSVTIVKSLQTTSIFTDVPMPHPSRFTTDYDYDATSPALEGGSPVSLLLIPPLRPRPAITEPMRTHQRPSLQLAADKRQVRFRHLTVMHSLLPEQVNEHEWKPRHNRCTVLVPANSNLLEKTVSRKPIRENKPDSTRCLVFVQEPVLSPIQELCHSPYSSRPYTGNNRQAKKPSFFRCGRPSVSMRK
jgi:hypothetical protein